MISASTHSNANLEFDVADIWDAISIQKILQIRVTPSCPNISRYVSQIQKFAQDCFQTQELKQIPLRLEISRELINMNKYASILNSGMYVVMDYQLPEENMKGDAAIILKDYADSTNKNLVLEFDICENPLEQVKKYHNLFPYEARLSGNINSEKFLRGLSFFREIFLGDIEVYGNIHPSNIHKVLPIADIFVVEDLSENEIKEYLDILNNRAY